VRKQGGFKTKRRRLSGPREKKGVQNQNAIQLHGRKTREEPEIGQGGNKVLVKKTKSKRRTQNQKKGANFAYKKRKKLL